MIHCPCSVANTSSPCMKDGKCSRYYPRNFQNSTIVDQDGYPNHRKRGNGHIIVKNSVTIDNHNVLHTNRFY